MVLAAAPGCRINRISTLFAEMIAGSGAAVPFQANSQPGSGIGVDETVADLYRNPHAQVFRARAFDADW